MAVVGVQSRHSKIPTSQGTAAEDNHVFDKTKLCKFWMKHRCKRGEDCTFAHSTAELLPQPDFYKTQLCSSLATDSSCPHGEACQFAHSEEELRKSTKNPRGPRNKRHTPGQASWQQGGYTTGVSGEGPDPAAEPTWNSRAGLDSPSRNQTVGATQFSPAPDTPTVQVHASSGVTPTSRPSTGSQLHSPSKGSTSAFAPRLAKPMAPGLVSTSQNSTQPSVPHGKGTVGEPLRHGPIAHQAIKPQLRQQPKLHNKSQPCQAGSASGSSNCSFSASKATAADSITETPSALFAPVPGPCGSCVSARGPPGSFVQSHSPSMESSPVHLNQVTVQPESQRQRLKDQHLSQQIQSLSPQQTTPSLHHQLQQRLKHQLDHQLQLEKQLHQERQHWQLSRPQQGMLPFEGVFEEQPRSDNFGDVATAVAVAVVSGTTAASVKPNSVSPTHHDEPPVFLPFCAADTSEFAEPGLLRPMTAADLKDFGPESAILTKEGVSDPDNEDEEALGCITVKNTFLHIEETQSKPRLRHHSLPRRIMFE